MKKCLEACEIYVTDFMFLYKRAGIIPQYLPTKFWRTSNIRFKRKPKMLSTF